LRFILPATYPTRVSEPSPAYVAITPSLSAGSHPRDAWARLPWTEIAILALALVLRVALLDIKPAHFDEGLNGVIADRMMEQGFFRYDPVNYHGPLHFYAVFVSQTLFGRDLWALRLPAIIAGLLAVWALLRHREFFGPVTARIAALALAVSPAGVFYGRYSIHESWLLLFQITFLWGVLGLWQKGGRRFFFTAVFSAAGMVLTKETYVLHLGCFVLAAATLWAWQKARPSRPAWPVAKQLWTTRDAARAGGLGVLVIVFFYSGNFFDFSILHGLYQTFGPWLEAGVSQASGHEKTDYALGGVEYLNYYWLALMARYEWPALLGLAACFRYLAPSDARLRYVAIYGGGVLLAYTLIPYKTPWCILSILWPLFLLFGAAVQEAWQHLRTSRASRALRVAVIAGAALPLVVSLGTSMRLNFFRYDDETEPYVYVQTFRDICVLTDPLLGMAKRDPRLQHVRGLLLLDSAFPLPWMLGDFTQLAFVSPRDQPAGALTHDFVVGEKQNATRIERALEGAYFKREFRLRSYHDDCVVYFREKIYAAWFVEQNPPAAVSGPGPESAPTSRSFPETP
jgi:uncharacterized protein (TIGR03663 family)